MIFEPVASGETADAPITTLLYNDSIWSAHID
jgi:hypothetical protein